MSCAVPPPEKTKSDLVKKLEGIFDDPTFAKVPDIVFNIVDYGAVGDGVTLDTKAIQDCIDKAADTGGGVVCVPNGVFLSGALFLKSNVELRLKEDATIRAIQDDSQYPEIWSRIAGVEMDWPAALINVYQAKHVRITGKGTIDGNGKYWWDKFWGDPPRSGGMFRDYESRGLRWAVDYDCKRVRGVVAYDSEDILMKDFTVMRSGFWTVTMTYCARAHVDGVIVRNNIAGYGPSSDGINTDSSTDVLVENCDIDCNDDNLCIKSGKDADGLRVNRPAENIVYRNSVTRSGHGLLTLGSETSGGMRNIEVYGLKAVGTTMGLRFKSAKVRGGVMENIVFHDIEMDQVKYPFHFELNWYPEYSYPTIPANIPRDTIPVRWHALTQPVDPPEKGIPEFRDLTFCDIEVTHAGQAFFVNAYPEKPMRNIRWKNVSIAAAEPGEINHALDWTMANVTLELPGPEMIALVNTERVQVAHYALSAAGPAKEKAALMNLDALLNGTLPAVGPGILAVDECDRMIAPGDTVHPESIKVFIQLTGSHEISFLEPWGDGVVTCPVSIHYDEPENQLTVTAERAHPWTFYIKKLSAPMVVDDADAWEYDAKRQWLVLEKTGSSFTIGVKDSGS
tara:strand:+ start:29176 stop:31041 length:1866 start_codon:yes stop_codon:yes gene_type:complete